MLRQETKKGESEEGEGCRSGEKGGLTSYLYKLSALCLAFMMNVGTGRCGNSPVLDSLRETYLAAKDDTLRIKLLIGMTEEACFTDPPYAIISAKKAIKMARQIGDQTDESEACWWLAYVHDHQEQISEALQYYHISRQIDEELGNLDGQSVTINNIASLYDRIGDIPKAMEMYHQSLAIREALGDTFAIAASLHNIGFMYVEQGDTSKGCEYLNTSLKLKSAIGDKSGMAISYNAIGGLCIKSGSEQMKYFKKCLAIREALGEPYPLCISLQNVGNYLCRMDSFTEGMRMMKRGLNIAFEINNKQRQAFGYDLMSMAFLQKGLADSAEFYANKGIELSRKIGYPENIKRSADRLYDIFKIQGRWEEALDMYELLVEMRDSLNNEVNTKSMVRQQTKYEFEKTELLKEQEEKERQRALAGEVSRRNNLQYSGITMILIIMFIGILVTPSIGGVSRKIPQRFLEAAIFLIFLIFFEFLLVLADPYIEGWSGGAPGIKLLFNAGIAACIFPVHNFFERKLKKRLSG